MARQDPAARHGSSALRRAAVVLTSGARGDRLYHAVLALVDPGAPIVAYLAPTD